MTLHYLLFASIIITTMLEGFKQHPYLSHFLLYCFTWFVFAFQITGLGAYIPYMADEYHHKQTDYSFLFSCRSFGSLAGAFLFKFMQSHKIVTNCHRALIVSLVMIWVLMSFFAMAESILMQGVWFFLGAVAYAFVEVIPNVLLVMINPPATMQSWLLFAHGSFGVGGLIGPIFVYLFEMNMFYVTSTLYLLLIPFYLRLPSPQGLSIQHQHHHQDDEGNKVKPHPATTKLIVLLGLGLFFELGVQFNIGGWISTFAILAGSDTKETAGIYVTVFWIGMTFMRFGMRYISATSSQKMKTCLELIMGIGLFVVVLVYMGYVKLACYIGCVLFGLTMAPLFPLVFSIVNEFNFKLDQHQTTSIVMCAQISEGTLAAVTGVLMEWFGYQVLIWWVMLLALAMWTARHFAVEEMLSQGKADGGSLELNNLNKQLNQ